MLIKFIHKAVEVIKKDGLIFIYTRTRSQNACNIWGQYFPFFCEKETGGAQRKPAPATIRVAVAPFGASVLLAFAEN